MNTKPTRRAAEFAKIIGHSRALFIKLAIDDQLASDRIEARVTVEVA